MVAGRIVRFDEVRGYGFISPDEGGEDVFVHANDLLDDKHAFAPGTQVEFQVTTGERGLKGYDVRVVGGRNGAPGRSPRPSRGDRGDRVDRADADFDEDGMCDVLSAAALREELTETFIQSVPDLTGAQILQLRQIVVRLATKHGWVED